MQRFLSFFRKKPKEEEEEPPTVGGEHFTSKDPETSLNNPDALPIIAPDPVPASKRNSVHIEVMIVCKHLDEGHIREFLKHYHELLPLQKFDSGLQLDFRNFHNYEAVSAVDVADPNKPFPDIFFTTSIEASRPDKMKDKRLQKLVCEELERQLYFFYHAAKSWGKPETTFTDIDAVRIDVHVQ